MGPGNFFWINKDEDNHCIDCSENAPALLGSTRERILGIHEKEILPPDSCALILEMDNLARENGAHCSTDYLFIKGQWFVYAAKRTSPDGKHIKFEATDITAQADPTGMLQGIDHVKRTITFPLSGYTASEMELKILNYHLRGWKNKDIAKKLERSVKAIDKQLSNMRQRSADLYPGATMQEALKAGHVYQLLAARDCWFMPTEVIPPTRQGKPPLTQNIKKPCKVSEKMRKKVEKALTSREFPTDTRSLVR